MATRKDLNKLEHLFKRDGTAGMTFGPSFYETAIAKTNGYGQFIANRIKGGVTEANLVYDSLLIEDVQVVADKLRSNYEHSGYEDGYVSLMMSSRFVHDPKGTVEEARRLWKAIERPNIMLEVPGSTECLPAISQLLSEGINVNVTLLFSVLRYQEVLNAFQAGIKKLQKSGGDLKRVMSVASFFVNGLDSAVDKMIQYKINEEPDAERAGLLYPLLGTIASSSVRIAYIQHEKFQESNPWKRLFSLGARPQKLLLADTSIAMTQKTLEIMRDHGTASVIKRDYEAKNNLQILHDCGISLVEITDQLFDREITLFSECFDRMVAVIEKKKETIVEEVSNHVSEDFSSLIL